MDRVNQLRGDGAGGSRDSSLDGSGAGDSFLTANDSSSKYYSLTEDDFDLTKDVSLASTSSESSLNASDCFPNLSPIAKKDLLDYKIGTQIEAANILSGGVNIFDDNENSYDGNELVIDDNAEIDKSPNLKSPEHSGPFPDSSQNDKASTSKSLDSTLQDENVEPEKSSKTQESSASEQNKIEIEQSSTLKAPEPDVPEDKADESENLEAVVENAPLIEQAEAEAIPIINIEPLEVLPLDNGVVEIADLPIENGVAEIGEIAHLPLEEAEVGEANLPNDIGEANLPNDNVVEHADIAEVADVQEDRTEVVLQIDGNNVAAINIGTGLYLYRKEGQEELAAVQIVEEEEPSFKFLKVRENAEGNLEVYEEIQEVVVVPQEMPVMEVQPTPVTVTAGPSGENNAPAVCEPSTSREVEKKDNAPENDPAVPSTSRQDEPNKDAQPEKSERNVNGKMVKISESRKSPLMAYHSTPNKGIPLTKTMVDQQLHPNRHSDNIKKTIEVHTDNCKQKALEQPSTSKCKDFASPDKKSEESSVHKTNDKDTQDKKQISIMRKESVPEIVKKKSEVIASSSGSSSSLASQKAEAIKPNDKEKEVLISKNKELDIVSNISHEQKKKTELDEKSNKSIEIPSTSKHISHEENKKTELDEKSSKSIEIPSTSKHISHDEKKTELNEKYNKTVEVPSTSKHISHEEKKKTELDEKPKKSLEFPRTSKHVEEPCASVSKETKIVEKAPFATQQSTKNTHVTTAGQNEKEAKDLKMSPTPPLALAPLEVNKSKIIPEIEKRKETPVPTSSKIFESYDMEVDEDVLVIEEQIEIPPEVCESKKQGVEVGPSVVETKSKLIDDQIKSVLGTGETKPATSLKNKISPVATLDNNKSNKIDMTANSVKEVINADKSGSGNKTGFEKKSTSFSKEEVKGTNSTGPQLNHIIKPLQNDLIKKSIIWKEGLIKNVDQPKIKETIPIKPVENKVSEIRPNSVASAIVTAKINDLPNDIHNKPEKTINKPESTGKNNMIEKQVELSILNAKDINTSTPVPVKEHRHTNLPINTQHLLKPPMKTDLKLAVINAVETKKEINHKPILNTVESKPKSINNNHAPVPFGKWTEANRQEFLSKFKEAKPVNMSNANHLKQPNDLNRRDVLKKIDSQRQNYNANVKIQESLNKANAKMEAFASKTVPATITKQETKVTVKPEVSVVKPKPTLEKNVVPELKQVPLESACATVSTATKKEPQRKEINNQDLIDKTIEGIINRAVTGKSPDDMIQTVTEKPTFEKVDKKPEQKSNTKPTLLDAIEMKMNELHGIPFVERPPHELPRPYTTEPKVSKIETHSGLPQKVSKIPNLLPLPKSEQKLKDCEKVINLETCKEKSSLPSLDLSKTGKTLAKTPSIPDPNAAKDKIITEKEFDKFARRNSVTYENCLTVTESHQVIQTVVPREAPPKKISRNEQMLAEAKAKSPHKHLPIKQYHPSKASNKYMPATDNKQYQSKLQLAYQTAMTAKRRIDSPITIIEDKPVKVVYLDSNVSEFASSQLNVQGRDLSPAKRPAEPEPDAVTVGTCDSLDSDILDAIDDIRQEEVKTKSKHQRKQVLTPVETPDLELIEPSDLGIEISPKKKRKTEDRPEKKQNLVPKKSYLLGRSAIPAEAVELSESRPIPPPAVHNDAVSAIDSLVKAAELLENQSESLNASIQSVDSSQGTPVKRGRGRPRKNPLPDSGADAVSPQKKPRLIDAKVSKDISSSEDSDDDFIIKENWTMGKINEKIVCPICNKLFRSENVVFKHVKHCTGPSPSRSDSGKRSPRRSRLSREDTKSTDSESKSRGSTNDNDEADLSPVRKTPKKRKSKDSGKSSSSVDVIPIEPEPKETQKDVVPTKTEPRKTLKPELNLRTSNLVCEICGKSFRQLSYLVSHKLQHKKEEKKPPNELQVTDKSVFSCETCQKEFRKLHHLVQHRLIHNPIQSRALRKTSSEQKELPKNQDAKLEDQSAGFRCEPCDKSFRKLHHLVEHRETHDGINRQRSNSITQVPEKEKPTPPPQCDICKKTFRKLHHLIEHKEQHQDTSSEKSDDQKSVKSSLSTKDIIHECNLCYMVFPNEHSLNKHTVICLKKKKQSAAKQAAVEEEKNAEDSTKVELPAESKIETVNEQQPVAAEVEKKVEKPPEKPIDPPKTEVPQVKEAPKPEIIEPVEKIDKQVGPKEVEKKPAPPENPPPTVANPADTPAKIKQVDEIIVIEDTPKKKPIKDKVAPTVTKRQKVTPTEERVAPSSDDEEVRYMFNPDFKTSTETSEAKTFTNIRAKKRNSLQFERSQKDQVRKRSLLQHPPKISRRAKSDDVAPLPPKPAAKPQEEVPATDSDDSDVKYSFPPAPVPEKQDAPEEPKRRKTIAEKRKSLSGIAKRKSLGKAIVKSTAKTTPAKPIKRRAVAVEHRCDCGQLFSSAALLARHASLAHTPPRVRRPRDADAGNQSDKTRNNVDKTRKNVHKTRKSVDKPRKTVEQKSAAADTPGEPNRKSSVEQQRKSVAGKDSRSSVDQRKSVASKDSGRKPSVDQRKTVANSVRKVKTPSSRKRVHTGVPLPEKRSPWK